MCVQYVWCGATVCDVVECVRMCVWCSGVVVWCSEVCMCGVVFLYCVVVLCGVYCVS